MFADHKWSKCNGDKYYGVYIWTAGAYNRERIKYTKFAWKFMDGRHRPIITGRLMHFEFWNTGQPDNSGGNERCVNLWKDHYYRWNDEECEHKYCFVCQNFLFHLPTKAMT